MRPSLSTSDDERLVASLQDHWIVLVLPGFLYVFSWGFAYGLYTLGVAWRSEQPNLSLLLWLIAFVVITLVHQLFFGFLLCRELSSWVLTSKRIVEFSFLPYFRHDIEVLPISEIHEIEKKKHGLLANLLNYGNLEINIGTIPTPFVFENVPRPTELANLITELYKLNHPPAPKNKPTDTF